jgi:pimeloyl-ACP methyl ester carboxylesterase
VRYGGRAKRQGLAGLLGRRPHRGVGRGGLRRRPCPFGVVLDGSGKRARTVETEAEVREFELPFPQGDNAEGVNATTNDSMLTGPLPVDLPYAVMFDAYCEDFPPPLRNQRDCTQLVHLLAATDQELARVGAGGRFVWAKGAGHDIQVTQPEAVLATVDRVWKAARRR